MNNEKVNMLLYFANLLFIVTNLYGWLLKRFYTAKPYIEHFEVLFPAQRFVGLLYFAQLMEIPYLLMIGQYKALFYINAFSALYFASMMVVIGKGYFFWRKYRVIQLILYFLPMFIPVVWLLLAAMDVVWITPNLYNWMFWVVCAVFIYYIIRVMVVQRMILCKAKDIMEGNGGDDNSFPIPLSLRTRWLMLPVPILMFVCFLCNDMYVKMTRDILFTIVNVWFLLYTIKPHRKILQEDEVQKDKTARYKLSSERCAELEQHIIDKMDGEKLFLNPSLTIDLLAEQVGSNKNYVSEAINRGDFGSYYALVNHYRLEHAIMMLKQNPKQKIEYVSNSSGFSSKSVFSQIFKRNKGVSPTQFIEKFLIKTE